MEAKVDELAVRTALIQHLSKEIETISSGVTTLRVRVVFVTCVGPFVVLSAFVFRQASWTWPKGDAPWCSLVAVGLTYLLTAVVIGYMEAEVGDKCNRLRELMAQLATKEAWTTEALYAQLMDPRGRHAPYVAYVCFFLLVMASLGAVVGLLRWATT